MLKKLIYFIDDEEEKRIVFVNKKIIQKVKSDLISLLIQLNTDSKDTEKKPYKRKKKKK